MRMTPVFDPECLENTGYYLGRGKIQGRSWLSWWMPCRRRAGRQAW
jgi:hypothetical protein